ncbi:hypothetical protein J6A31_06125 [bacterium]|nr:hypothetical protein [bacterium]
MATQYLLVTKALGMESYTKTAIIDTITAFLGKSPSEMANMTYDDAVKHAKLSIYSTAESSLWRNISFAEKENLRSGIAYDEYDFKSEIVIFPLKNRVLMMIFGNKLQNFFSTLITEPEYQSLCEKYNLRDYHYQNQTDRPENISAQTWAARGRVWNKLMKTGVPAEDGMNITLTNFESMYRIISLKQFHSKESNLALKNDIFSNAPSKDKQLNDYAFEIAKIEYYDKHRKDSDSSVSYYITANEAFRNDIKNEKPEILTRMSEIKKTTENALIDFSNNDIIHDIFSLSIIEFLDKYSN